MQKYRVAAATAGILTLFGLSHAVLAQDQVPEVQAQAKTVIDEKFAFEHVTCSGAENEIRVIVRNVKKETGVIVADLYPNKEDGFLRSRNRLVKARVAARSPQTYFCMTAPSAGDYAIGIYHDKNANKEFDKGAFGLPAEPYGVSNNPKMRFGPPSAAESIFEVASDGANTEIKLKN